MGTETTQVVESKTYRGLTKNRGSITYKPVRNRVQKLRVRLEMLKMIGLNAKYFRSRLCENMSLRFIREIFEYCSHLLRIETETILKY